MRLLEIYDGTLFEAQMVKNLLEIEGIESILKDQIIGNSGGGFRPAGGVKVIVSDTDFERAKRIVEEYEKSQSND